jgi:hypothetical protein
MPTQIGSHAETDLTIARAPIKVCIMLPLTNKETLLARMLTDIIWARREDAVRQVRAVARAVGVDVDDWGRVPTSCWAAAYARCVGGRTWGDGWPVTYIRHILRLGAADGRWGLEDVDRILAVLPGGLRQLPRRTDLAGFTYVPERDVVVCPEGKSSVGKARGRQGDHYFFSTRDCKGCPRAKSCLSVRERGPQGSGRKRVYLSDSRKALVKLASGKGGEEPHIEEVPGDGRSACVVGRKE